jgi:hypothetical protein
MDKEEIRRVANRQNADLRDLHIYNTKDFSPNQFVFLDESGTDKREGFRRTGWAPSGVTPVQIARFQREQRYQILPAYTLDGIIFSRMTCETTIKFFSPFEHIDRSNIDTQGLLKC